MVLGLRKHDALAGDNLQRGRVSAALGPVHGTYQGLPDEADNEAARRLSRPDADLGEQGVHNLDMLLGLLKILCHSSRSFGLRAHSSAV